MKIKVCGLKEPDNICRIAREQVDLLGFIFHPESPRNVVVTDRLLKEVEELKTDKVGVFVNQNFEFIQDKVKAFNLQYVQLHGNEQPELVNQLKNICKVIKAFNVDEFFDFGSCTAYQPDLFLFDAKGEYAGGNGTQFKWDLLANYKGSIPFLLSGGISLESIQAIKSFQHPQFIGVDINSGFEERPGLKKITEISQFTKTMKTRFSAIPSDGFYGDFGGAFVPELLHNTIEELQNAFDEIKKDDTFQSDYRNLLKDYVGRPSPLYYAPQLSKKYGCNLYLKREDLNHTGAHKVNNTIGQILLAKRMGKKRIIAETGAGQHGVATATVCALMGLECIVYMGEVDIQRQAPNVGRMKMLGATVVPAASGSKTLKDATNEAIRDWINNPTSFYIIGSVVGPHPYPEMVAYFQAIISEEIKLQLYEKTGKTNPDTVVACVGGGSNAAGAFYHYLDQKDVELIAAEAAGHGVDSGKSAATTFLGTTGIIHGSKTLMMQTQDGQIVEPHSISAGLDYPGIGPLHAHLVTSKRAKAVAVTDKEALAAGFELTKLEGIIPALESAHALAALNQLDLKGKTVVLNLSGRGDKDLETYLKNLD